MTNLQRFNTTNDAIAIAKFAHFKQKDQAGFDYFEHPRRVMQKVMAQGAAPYVQQAAVMHDVTEDTSFTSKMLADLGFSPAVTLLLDLLDRDESRRQYGIRVHGGYDLYGATTADEFYYLAIRRNSEAKMIKDADIDDNTEAWRLMYLPTATQVRLYNKYAKGKNLLHDMDLPAHLWFPRLNGLDPNA